MRPFETFDPEFRNNYQMTFARGGQAYDYYVPAYRYGYTTAYDPRFSNRDWEAANDDLQRGWESEHPGTWQNMKSAIRYAWDRARGRAA